MTEIKSTDYFAIVPEFVIYAPISSNAVRLYAILNRFANSQGRAWPSRKTLAELMQCSTATIDRAKEELVELGALTIEARTTPSGDPSSNLYILHTSLVDNSGTSSPVTQGILTREGRGTPTGDALNRDSMNHRKTRPSSCQECLGKYTTGYDDDTEGLAHIWSVDRQEFLVCPSCAGSGQKTKT
jgi:hypothetical protein